MGKITWRGLMVMRINLSRPIVHGWSCHLAVLVNGQLPPYFSIKLPRSSMLRQCLRWTNVQMDRQMNIRIDERTGEQTLAVKELLTSK